MANNVRQVTDCLASSEIGMRPWLWLPLLKLRSLLTPAPAGRPVEEVGTALVAMTDAEYDGSGRIVGMGLTQCPTRRRIEVDGDRLHLVRAGDPDFPHPSGHLRTYRAGVGVRFVSNVQGP